MRTVEGDFADALQHAADEFPSECCGLIYRSRRVRRCRNIAGRTDRFELDADDVLAIYDSFDTDDPVRAIYHSHCDVPAVFSSADFNGATWCDQPLFAELDWLIIECRNGRPVEMVTYQWRDGRFRPIIR